MGGSQSGNVIVRGSFRVTGQPPSLKDFNANSKTAFEDFCRDIGRNALVGTFQDFSDAIFPNRAAFSAFSLRTRELSRCVADLGDDDIRKGSYGFKLLLDYTVFADPDLGFQKLVHVLVSDLFEPRGIGPPEGQVFIETVELGELVPIFSNNTGQKVTRFWILDGISLWSEMSHFWLFRSSRGQASAATNFLFCRIGSTRWLPLSRNGYPGSCCCRKRAH